jgi:hypothetical protein
MVGWIAASETYFTSLAGVRSYYLKKQLADPTMLF